MSSAQGPRRREKACPWSPQISGFVSWWIWLFLHIAFMTGYRNRLGALLTWWLAFSRDVRRKRTFTTQQIAVNGVRERPELPTSPALVGMARNTATEGQ
jgi:hypothetical protein